VSVPAGTGSSVAAAAASDATTATVKLVSLGAICAVVRCGWLTLLEMLRYCKRLAVQSADSTGDCSTVCEHSLAHVQCYDD
jgi:hypothetical protein